MGGIDARVYLVGVGLAPVGFLLLPPLQQNPLVLVAVALCSAAAIGAGLVAHRPPQRLPWVLFGVAQGLFGCAALLRSTAGSSAPSIADGLFLASYLATAAGLLLLIRIRTQGKNMASLLDAVIVTTGLGLLMWVYLIDPERTQTGGGEAARILALTYPAIGAMLLAIALRLVLGTTSRPPSFRLIAASITVLLLTNVLFGVQQLTGTSLDGGSLDLGWMVASALFGTAALHPSMATLTTSTPTVAVPPARRHYAVLAASTLVAPILILVNGRWPIEGFNVPGAAGASAVVFVLLMLRMLGLVTGERQAVARHRQSLRREIILRQAATELAAASDPERIRSAIVAGAHDLVQRRCEIWVDLDSQEDDELPRWSPRQRDDVLVIPLATSVAEYGRIVLTSPERVSPMVLEGLQMLGVQASLKLESVTLSERLHQQRRESWVGALVQNSADVIMVLDPGLAIRYVTPSVEAALGHRPADLVGEALSSFVDPEAAGSLAAVFAFPEHRRGETLQVESRLRRADGTFTDVELVSSDQRADPGVKGFVLIARDISGRKALEDGLKRQVAKLQEIDRIRSEFVATVSHELRTPLTNIIGQVELLVDGDLGDLAGPQAHGVEVIARNSERLFSMIDDLLTLSHIETGELPLHFAPTPVVALVDDMRQRVRMTAAAKSVDLVLDCCPDIGVAVLDREQMGRALLNLLTNAVKFTPSGGSVDLRARRVGDDLVVTVEDTGMGIPLEEQARLFTRFFRSSNAARMAIQGTGLGLVIVKKIVEGHGGAISISSVPDQGTSVTVTVPAGLVPDPVSSAA